MTVRMPDRRVAALVCCVSLFAAAWGCRHMKPAHPVSDIPAGGSSLISGGVDAWRLVRPGPDAAGLETVETEGVPFADAVRVTTSMRPRDPWNIEILQDVTQPIRQGDVCLLVFWMRRIASADESGDAVALAFVQQNYAPHTKVISHRAAVDERWRQFCLPFQAGHELVPGKANMGFHLGYHPQTLEIGGVQLLNYEASASVRDLPGMRVTYEGRSPDARWRRAAQKRIERYRMSDLTVMVADASGKPIPDARVNVTMTRHAFGFGSAVVARLLMDESADGEAYRRVVAENYTRVVFENDLKWGPWEAGKSGEHASFRRPWVEGALTWLNERNIDVRGHWLSWGSVTSGGQQKFVGRPAEHRQALFDHIREIVPAVGDRVVEWDAINHPVGWGVTYEEMHGGLDFHVDIFRLCREVAPQGVEMWINEGQILPGGGRRAAYERIIRYLIDHGQTPDGIGFMGHFGTSSLTPMEEVYDVFEHFADIIPALQLTELDVNIANDEQLQADYLRDVMTLAFSHPDMKGILMWGFWEGKIWKPDTALYRKDWTLKPAGEAWLDLVKNQWWTRIDGHTDKEGELTVRAFHGTYTIDVVAEGRTKTVQAEVVPGSTTVGVRLR